MVIDAIDEVSEFKFKEQIREIDGYANMHPNMRIVFSCRSNYSYLIDRNKYLFVYLGTLTREQVMKIIESNAAITDPKHFIYEIQSHGYSELTSCPFFLNNLMSYYVKKGNLPPYKSTIFDFLIEQSYREEVQKKITDQEITKGEERQSLETVATVMQTIGRNSLTTEELKCCLKDNDLFFKNTIHYGILNFLEQPQQSYQFVYNSLKEYLAASCLANKNLDSVKMLVCTKNGTRVATHWYNTISLYCEIKSSKNGGMLPKEIFDWLVKENKDILLHTGKNQLDFKTREHLLIDYIEENNNENLTISNFDTESTREIVEYGQSCKLISYLIDNINSAQIVDKKFGNLICIAKYVNWVEIRKDCPNLAEKLEDTLLSILNGQKLNDKTEWICSLWLQNETLPTEHFLKKLIPIAINSCETLVITNTLGAISKSNVVDRFYEEIMNLHTKIENKYDLTEKINLYNALSKLKEAKNVNDAFIKISNSHFYIRDFSMENYREMEKSLLRTAESLYKNGDPNIVNSIKKALDNRLRSYFVIRNAAERESVISDYKQFFMHIGIWDSMSSEFEKLITSNTYEPNMSIIQNRKETNKKHYKELSSEAQFTDIVLNLINDPNEIEFEEFIHKFSEKEIEINQYAFNFILQFTKKLGNNSYIDKDEVRKALTDGHSYQELLFEENVKIIEGYNSDIELNSNIEKQIKDFATTQLYILCDSKDDFISPHQKKAIDLLLSKVIEINPDYLMKLMRFSGFPFIYNIDELIDNEHFTLFSYIQSKLGVERIKEYVYNQFSKNIDLINQANFKTWTSFACQQHMQEVYPQIIDRLCKEPDDICLIQEQVTFNRELRELFLETLEQKKLSLQKSISLINDIMCQEDCYNNRIIDMLESNIKDEDPKTQNEALQILIRFGNFKALEIIETDPNIIEIGGIFSFNYNSIDCIDKLVNLLGHFGTREVIPNPSESIMSCITNIALQSTTNMKIIEGKLKELVDKTPQLKQYVLLQINFIKDTYAAQEFMEGGIKNTIDWINS